MALTLRLARRTLLLLLANRKIVRSMIVTRMLQTNNTTHDST